VVPKLKLAETMKKVLAKTPRRDSGVEILIGGGDDADIYGDLTVASQTVEGRSVQHAQKLNLSLKLQFADFIEEERALVGELKQAGLGRIRASKCALFIAE